MSSNRKIVKNLNRDKLKEFIEDHDLTTREITQKNGSK